MNIGKDNRHPRYICDKCKKFIYYEPQKGFEGLNKYYHQIPSNNITKDFDLCAICEKKLREWLNTREIPTIKEVISIFPQYKKG